MTVQSPTDSSATTTAMSLHAELSGPDARLSQDQADRRNVGYSGKTATTFTAAKVAFWHHRQARGLDSATPQERRPEIEEFVYLRCRRRSSSAPMTGELYADNAKLPAHWHAGVSMNWVRVVIISASAPTSWVPGDDAKGLPVRFIGIGGEEAKRFIETELLKLLDAVQPGIPDGTVGLRRPHPRVSSAATPVAWGRDRRHHRGIRPRPPPRGRAERLRALVELERREVHPAERPVRRHLG